MGLSGKKFVSQLLYFLAKNILIILFLQLFYIKPVRAASWQNSGIDNYTIGVIKISPVNSSLVYANGSLNTVKDLFKSTDGGNTWFPLATNSVGLPSNPDINSIALHPTNPNILYVGIYDQGIYKSTDGGINWSPSGLHNFFIRALTIDKSNPLVLFAGTGTNNSNGGVYKSIDGGISWQLKANGMGKPNILEIVIDDKSQNIVYASGHRLWKSTNAGEGWTLLSLSAGVPENGFAIDPTDSQILYAAQVNQDFGIYKSLDGGLSWTLVGLDNQRVHEIIIDSEDGRIYASTRGPNFPGGGVYFSNNSGQSWGQLNDNLPTLETAALTINYNEPKKLLLGTIGFGLWSYNLSSPQLLPIIFIPGFFGSWNKNMLSQGYLAEGEWKALPWPYEIGYNHSYKNILEAFKSSGYKDSGPEQNLYVFYYNYLAPIENTSEGTAIELKKYIESVLVDKPPDTKVNLIGHSMGGLLARVYVQLFGSTKINRLITLGSPHQGAIAAYEAWEGGQFDGITGKILGNLLLVKKRKKYAHRALAVRDIAPSLYQLIPIFNFLKHPDDSVISSQNINSVNNWLKNKVESLPSFLNQITSLIYGELSQAKTKEWLILENPYIEDILLGIWKDGHPIESSTEYTAKGDGAILTKSSTLQGFDSYILENKDHAQIINSEEGIKKIFELLEIPEGPILQFSEINNSYMIFNVQSPVNILVATPKGEIGYGANNPLIGTYIEESKLIIIPTPIQGNYTVQLIGIDNDIYHLQIGYVSQEEEKWQTIKGKITTGETIEYKIVFDPEFIKDSIIDDPNGEIFLNLTMQQLEHLHDLIGENTDNFSVRKRLQYQLKRIISYMHKAINFANKRNPIMAAKYTFTSLVHVYRLRQSINKYSKTNKMNTHSSVYLKNELAEITKNLDFAWLILYDKSGEFISESLISRYQKLLQRMIPRILSNIEKKAKEGENILLGSSLSLFNKEIESAKFHVEQGNYNEAYIKLVGSRLLLLEILYLAK